MYRAVLLTLATSTAVLAQPLPPVLIQPPLDGWPCPEPCPPLGSDSPESRLRIAPAGDIVLQWNAAALAAIRAERTPPPLAARHLAVIHLAMYDALNGVTRTHQPFAITVTAPAGASAEAAASAAAHHAITVTFPRYAVDFDAVLVDSLAAIPDGSAKHEGAAYGRRVAAAVLAWRADDLAVSRSDYLPRPARGRWVPTPPSYRAALLPGWSNLPLFALPSVESLRPPGPPAITSREYAASYREVKQLGAIDSSVRTQEQTEIARFWEDGAGTATPPGHWNQIAATVAQAKKLRPSENARLFAALNVALADAAIACWDCKYRFDFWRPVTAIRADRVFADPALDSDPDWEPLLDTPPFPAYTSGHSSFSAAAAAVLAEFFGSDAIRFESTSEGLAGVVRRFDSFTAAAQEAGLSRIYGGIHWDFDNRDGLAGGRRVGEYVGRQFFQPVERRANRGTPAVFAIRSK